MSIEKAINFIMYNFPFFVFVVLLGFFINYSIKYVVLFFNFDLILDPTLGTWEQIKLLLKSSLSHDLLFHLKLLFIKYLKFFANNFILSLIFIFYSMRKNKLYMDSYFELED
ncbi:hypothetical protein GF385_02465 [Candidatus Dependentiae bacterium]|nr:hypothetical protein [Candidatus Dependentiae bacterium]